MAVATEPVAAGLGARGGGLRRGGAPSHLRRRRAAGWGRLPPVPPWSPSPGRWPPAVWPGPGGPRCLRARGARQRQLALLARPPVSIVQPRSALSSLFFLLPPTLPVSLPPPSLALLSLSPSLSLATSLPAPWLAGELSGSPSGSRRRGSRGSSRTPAPLVRANNDPASAELQGRSRGPGALQRAPRGAARPSPSPVPALPELGPSYCSVPH